MTETTGNVLSFSAKLAEARKKVADEKAKREAALAGSNPAGFDFSADVPDLGDEPEQSTDLRQDQEEFNKFIREYSIVDLYNRWKPSDRPMASHKGNRNQKVRCPNPTHTDKHASFGMHAGKNQWNCGTCGGGDNIGLYALTHGFDHESLKNSPAQFRAVVTAMAAELGVQKSEGISGTYYIVPGSGFTPPEAPTEEPETTKQEEVEDNVTVLPTRVDPEAEDKEINSAPAPEIDWRSFIPPNTFLWQWLVTTTQDSCPEEYHVWTGLMAIGFALGRNVNLIDERLVYGNLAVCLVGPSGAGKSRAVDHLKELTLKTMPDEFGQPNSVRQIGAASSGEFLLDKFKNVREDPTNSTNKEVIDVRGLTYYDEFSRFIASAGRQNSTLRQTFMELMSTPSLIQGGSMAGGTVSVKNPFFQVISTTQNEALSNLVSKADDASGFANRWVFAGGKLKERRVWGGVPIDLRVPMTYHTNLITWAEKGHSIHMEGTAAFKVYEEKLFPLILKYEDMLNQRGTSIGNRLEINAKKLILLFTANLQPDVDEVPVEAVEHAIKVFEYLVASTQKTDIEINKTDDSVLVAKIQNAIRAFKPRSKVASKYPTAAEIRKSVYRHVKSVDELAKILKNMEKLQMINVLSAPTTAKGGRPTERYQLAE
jgi:hypothetical protein